MDVVLCIYSNYCVLILHTQSQVTPGKRVSQNSVATLYTNTRLETISNIFDLDG